MELFFYTNLDTISKLSRGIKTHRDTSLEVFCKKVLDADKYSPGYRVLRVKIRL